MGLFFRGRERAQAIAELRHDTAKLKLENQRLRNERQEIQSRERLLEKLMDRTMPQGSMTSELYHQAFPTAERSRGGLSLYRSHWSASNDKLRRLSRIAAFESPTGGSLIGRLADLVVGSGLLLEAQPMWDLIAAQMPENTLAAETNTDAQQKWTKFVERLFLHWWKSKRIHYNLEYNGRQLDYQLFRYLLEDGEYFVLIRYNSSRSGSPMTLQIIPPENVVGGTTTVATNIIENGIEYDAAGTAVAYHVRDDRTGLTTRIPRFGPRSGRVLVIHNFLRTNEKQRRGVPYLANAIHMLTKAGDYETLEMQAALVNALYAVWVRPPVDQDGEPTIGEGATLVGDQDEGEGDPFDPTAEYLARSRRVDYSRGGVVVDALPAGHEIESFDTKRPHAGFDQFLTAIRRSVAAQRGVPLSAVDLNFTNSYSAARGELLLLWISIGRYVANHGADLHDIVYQMWMWTQVDRGRIQAPGFDYDEFLRDAYSNAEHRGNQRPDIDPFRSVNANILEHKYAYKTGQQITAERSGGDYNENLNTVATELNRVARANNAVREMNDGTEPPPMDPQDDYELEENR